LGSVPLALPALAQADQYQRRAARVGFDWTEIEGVLDKVREELDEVRSAPDEQARGRELGDLFFALVNLTRWYDLDAETILREANARFAWRFSRIEAAAREQGRLLTDLTLDEMEAFWQAAKRLPGS
jgi:MazG family protein